MRKKKFWSIYAIFLSITLILPILVLEKHHNCEHDDCFRIYYDDRVGMCVEKALDDMYFFIAIFWASVFYGSALLLSKTPNYICPFVIILLILLLSIYGALIDPSKWLFVISLFPSTILFGVAVWLDRKQSKM